MLLVNILVLLMKQRTYGNYQDFQLMKNMESSKDLKH